MSLSPISYDRCHVKWIGFNSQKLTRKMRGVQTHRHTYVYLT